MQQRKAVYLKKYPETENPNVRGGPGRGKKKTNAKLALVSFIEDTAKKTGRSGRSIRRDIHRAKKITPEVFDAAHTTTKETTANLATVLFFPRPGPQGPRSDRARQGRQEAKIWPMDKGVGVSGSTVGLAFIGQLPVSLALLPNGDASLDRSDRRGVGQA